MALLAGMSGPGDVDDASLTFLERFTIIVCRYNFVIMMAFVLETMLWALAILSYLFGDLDRGSRVVLLINFVLLGVATSITVGGLYLCNRRQ